MYRSRDSIHSRWLLAATLCILLLPLSARGEVKHPGGVECPAPANEQAASLEGASRSAVYRSIDGHDLQLYIFDPPAHRSSDRAAALILFHGGGWSRGNARQFEPQAKYFARRGMVVLLTEYRLRCRQGTGAVQAMSDARVAVGWVRSHSSSLGIDPNRIVAGGGSAGGHIALNTAMSSGEGDLATVDGAASRPDALLLFSTPVDLTPPVIRSAAGLDLEQSAALSPISRLRRGLPPTLFLQGKNDHLVSFSTVEDYCAKARALGNQCTVIGFDGGHTFFNRKAERAGGGSEGAELRKTTSYYREALEEAAKFLASLGYLSRP